MPEPTSINRRTLLRAAVALSAGTVAGPVVLRPWPAAWAATTTDVPFVEAYQTNVLANLTADTNAVIRILSGMAPLWQTGAAWNTGTVLAPAVLRANMRYVARITRTRTPEDEKRAYIQDRQHQSYAVITGLGPLADIYRAGALAVTSITSAPDSTPPTTVSDAVPPGAPAGSAIGAGSPTSALGAVVTLVNTVRGPYASSNPSKFSYQYPRPWRMTEDSTVVDTGVLDSLGYPVYESPVIVVPQLLRQRSTNPAEDGGYPSGHTNAFHLAALAFAYAIPERFQELVAAAHDLSETRIVAGMHSPTDVISGRIMATALAAATLNDPANATIKAAACSQAAAYLQEQTGTDAATLYAYAHSGDTSTDPYADRSANARLVQPRLTYGLPRQGRATTPMTVPTGAEVLLETRLPYLDAAQRREVLRTTAVDSGHPLLDGPELWGRLDLFAAADGYGSFDQDVTVELDAAGAGFAAVDTWRNDIDGRGGLVKRGTGALTLTGANRYHGATALEAGTLTAGSGQAFGVGDVAVAGGVLRVDPAVGSLRLHGDFRQAAGALAVTLRGNHNPVLTVRGLATLGKGSVLEIDVDPSCTGGSWIPVLQAGRLRGTFTAITVRTAGYRVESRYTGTGLSVRLRAA